MVTLTDDRLKHVVFLHYTFFQFLGCAHAHAHDLCLARWISLQFSALSFISLSRSAEVIEISKHEKCITQWIVNVMRRASERKKKPIHVYWLYGTTYVWVWTRQKVSTVTLSSVCVRVCVYKHDQHVFFSNFFLPLLLPVRSVDIIPSMAHIP